MCDLAERGPRRGPGEAGGIPGRGGETRINSLTEWRILNNFGPMTPRFEYKMRVPEVFLAPLRQKLEEFPGCAPRREKYLFVLHLVARQLKRAYHDARIMGGKVDTRTWHCNLQAVYLHAAIGNDYKSVLEDLINWGFIGRSFSYLPGDGKTRGRSKAFWFGWPYVNYWKEYCYSRERRMGDVTGETRKYGRTRGIPVKSRPFLKRLALCAADVKARQMLDPRVGACHDGLSHFSLDRKRAVKVLDRLVAEKSMTAKRKRRELAKVDRFNSVNEDPGALFVKKDRFGRIHTNVTQLKKEVRAECLYCDGKPTAGVDIKSSQGAFLGTIMRSLADECAALDLTESPSLRELRARAEIRDRGAYLEECGRYEGLVREGRLYEFFASEMSQDFDLDREVGREEAKHAFFVTLFGPVFTEGGDPMKGAVRRVWSEHFPCMLLAIERMKAGNYAALAREMQRVESSFVFDRAIPRITREVGCPYCTVHDEVIVEAGLVDRVRDLVEDELGKVGVPTMTSEEFGMAWKTGDEMEFDRDVELEMLGVYGTAASA